MTRIGYIQTVDHKINISKSLKSKKKQPFTIEHKENMRNAHIGKKLSDNHRKTIKNSLNKSEIKIKLIKNHANFNGSRNPMYGKHHTIATITIIKEKNKLRRLTEIEKDKIRKSINKKWLDPVFRDKNIKATLQAIRKRPTSFEIKITNIIQENDLPYKYVGDGSFLIGRKNPDFISTDHSKKCIEVFASYFKLKNFTSIIEYKKERTEYLQQYGYISIFIDEHEINDKALIIKKLI